MATNKKMVQWLWGELPAWQEKGLIGADTADGLRRYYEENQEPNRSMALVVCGVLGAVLIGLGIILLVAHNWDFMTRPQRALTAYLPLLAGIALTGWSIWNRPQSSAWCESSALFLMAAVGASIGLVSQTYHIMSDMAAFLLVWMLLTGPLAYLARARVVAALYWVGLLFFAGYARHKYGINAMLYWPLAAAMLPRLWMEHRENPGGPWELFLSWTLAITLCIIPPILLAGAFHHAWMLVYPSIFAALYVAARWQNREQGFWHEPFRVVSTAGIVVMALIFTSRHTWSGLTWWNADYSEYHWILTLQDYTLAFGLEAIALTLVALNIIKRRFDLLAFGALPAIVVAGFALSAAGYPAQSITLGFNLYLLVLALWVLARGIQRQQLSRMNGGLAILALLIFARFIDSDLPIVARGIVFILLGVGFLVTNVVMLRRKEAVR